MTVTTVAAILFALASAVGLGFQVAMTLGAPWGSYTMGGRFEGALPIPMRLAAALQAGVIGAMAALVLNTVTPSRGERRVWAPITAILAASSLTVALTGG